jgi:hypothetical protein
VDEDAHRAFIDDRIEVFLLCSGCLRGEVIEREELGIIVFELGFCFGQDELYLLVGVVIVIVVGDVVLDEMAELPEFLAVIRGFGGEGAVFPFRRFLEVIVNTYLPGGHPDHQQKYYR